MAGYSNADKLVAVVSEWARPAITQIATSKLATIPMMQSLESTISGSGIVGTGYSLAKDIEPMIQPVIEALIEPMLAQYISQVPDSAIPQLARGIVDKMLAQGSFSILDGAIVFEEDDILELDTLLKKNLPIESAERYSVIH